MVFKQHDWDWNEIFFVIFKHCESLEREKKGSKSEMLLGLVFGLGINKFPYKLLFNLFTRLQKFAKTESSSFHVLRVPRVSYCLPFLLTLQVLFRYAIAIFKYMESVLLKQCDYMTIYNTLRDGLEYLTDMPTLTQVSSLLCFTNI